jgi:hypothetical protein
LTPLAGVLADGMVTCDEHADRGRFNQCPAVPPLPGTDSDGVTWIHDLFLGIFPNPLHPGVDCYRGHSEAIAPSSFQCCYAGEELVDAGPTAGSFDFVYPYASPLASFWHLLFDILPSYQCGPG